MNKTLANVAYYGCFVAALVISYLAYDNAANMAYSGKDPLVWMSVLAFVGVIFLVVLAIVIKAKFKI